MFGKYFVVVLAGLCMGLLVTLKAQSAKVSDLRLDYELMEAAAHHSESLLEEERKQFESERKRELARIEVLNDKLDEVQALNDSVVAGAAVLRVNADCPELPQTTATPGRADDATPKLTDTARSNYFALRRGIAVLESQALGLQEFILMHCQGSVDE